MSDQQRRWILCGGLASGKSAVRLLLEANGVATIDADSIGHAVLEPDGPAFEQVAARWPQVVVSGVVDRARLAPIVFGDPGELAALERITHPHIFGTIRSRVEEITGPVVVEVPLISNQLGKDWRRVVVDCRAAEQLSRAVGRGMTREDGMARLAAQPNRSEWLAAADVVVPNHGTTENLTSAVETLVTVL